MAKRAAFVARNGEDMPEEFTLDPKMYAHLRAVATRVLGPSQQSIQATGLLHEAWAKLSNTDPDYVDRVHFMRSAAKAMRHILVDRARARNAAKRGGGAMRTTMTGLADPGQQVDVIELHDALKVLEEVDARAANIVLMRAFGGLTVPEIAELLDVSESVVKRKWRFARAWLLKELVAE